MAKRWALTLVALLALAGCAPDSGKVMDKRYDPAWTQWIAGMCHTVTSGKTTTTYCDPGHYQFWPEQWELKLDDGKDHGWKNVDEADYHRYAVGSTYP